MSSDFTTGDPREPRPLSDSQIQLAYSIVETLLEHTRVTSDLIAIMAQALDEDTVKALTNTPHWSAYLDSRRAMERARTDMEKFSAVMVKLSEDKSC